MNIITKINTQIEPSVFINNYAHDTTEDYELTNEKTPWIQEIVTELHEQLDSDDVYPPGSMSLKLEITRKKNPFIGDHLIVKAHIDAKYHLPCGITLKPLAQHMVLDLSASFLHDSQEKLPEYAEATTVYTDNEEMELYFYHKGLANIKEFIHEQIFLELPAFPRSQEELEEE